MDQSTHNRVRVLIHNTEYTLRGDASEVHMRKAAQRVDELMNGIASAHVRLDERQVAVLAALNLADNLEQLQSQYDLLQSRQDQTQARYDETQRRSDELQRQLDSLQAQYEDLVNLLDEQTRTSP
ncbi:cell division protein ZapA [Alicyclobacillaceae bacterium I2511]|nr:cell division protein ZapA [Alicyclobacillaceae bacterium I2511]